MDRLVDLDLVAAELQAPRAEWESHALEVGAFTWRDGQAPWPQPIVTERALVTDPESLGMTMNAGPDLSAQLVLWCGGWADLECFIDRRVITEIPEYRNVAECVAAAESLADLLLVGTEPRGPAEQESAGVTRQAEPMCRTSREPRHGGISARDISTALLGQVMR